MSYEADKGFTEQEFAASKEDPVSFRALVELWNAALVWLLFFLFVVVGTRMLAGFLKGKSESQRIADFALLLLDPCMAASQCAAPPPAPMACGLI